MLTDQASRDQASRDEAWQWVERNYPGTGCKETERGLLVSSRYADEIDGCFPPRLRAIQVSLGRAPDQGP